MGLFSKPINPKALEAAAEYFSSVTGGNFTTIEAKMRAYLIGKGFSEYDAKKATEFIVYGY
jgi:uncharacterized protein YhaN